MGGDYYAEAFNDLSDSDEFDDGKIGDWDVQLESDNNRIYNSNPVGMMAKRRKDTQQKQKMDQYASFLADSDQESNATIPPDKTYGVDFREEQARNIRESYEEDSFGSKRRSRTLIEKESQEIEIDFDAKNYDGNHPGYEQSETEDDTDSIFTID